jgi:hypothetical protein
LSSFFFVPVLVVGRASLIGNRGRAEKSCMVYALFPRKNADFGKGSDLPP